MRKDLSKLNIQALYPMYPYELAAVATIWYAAQLRKKGYLEMDYNTNLLVNSPRYLHTEFFKANEAFLMEIYDWAGGTDVFSTEELFSTFKYGVDSTTETKNEARLADMIALSDSLVRVYLATFRMTMGLAAHYARLFTTNYDLQDDSPPFFRKSLMLANCKFKVEKENPFICLVESLAERHYNQALLFCFLTVCPSGELKKNINLENSVIVYDAMSPFANLTAMYQNPQNYINIVDWMNI